MPTIQDRIKSIEEELQKTEYNKATEKHIGLLKAKLSKLTLEMESQKGGSTSGFAIPKSGDATVALVGFPNVGKSSLLNAMTSQESEVGNFAFTTLKVVPGILNYKGAQIQILDLPGIVENASRGAGRGREVLSIVRGADLVVIVTDVDTKGIEKIIRELHNSGIVLNEKKKSIEVKKTNIGGMRLHKPKWIDIDEEQVRLILKEFKIVSADVYIREPIRMEDLIDYLKGNVVYLPAIFIVNKVDLPHTTDNMEQLPGRYIQVSAKTGRNIPELKDLIFDSLDLIRVYMRKKSGEVDMERPMVLRNGSKVRDVARKISRNMISTYRYAIISGPNRKQGELRVGLDYDLLDEDVITIISRN